jgi:hypothetical protein
MDEKQMNKMMKIAVHVRRHPSRFDLPARLLIIFSLKRRRRGELRPRWGIIYDAIGLFLLNGYLNI